jgi:hypothetical protein
MTDTHYVDEHALQRQIKGSDAIVESDILQKEQEETQVAKEQAAQAQLKAEKEDPHGAKDPSKFGLGENITELKNAVLGGVRDTGSSFATAPERGADMLSGSMVKEIQETGDYEPDFNPLGGDLNPITKTWWGNFLRTGVHFGTMAVPIVGWGSAYAKGTGVLSGVTRATIGSSNWIIKGASVGAVQDLFSEYSQDANGLQVLRDRFGFIDTPCTTNDGDHPALQTVKSVCEGIGIGIPIEGGLRAIGKARHLKGKVNNPTNDVLKKVDAIESNVIFKAEQNAKSLVSKALRKKTIQRLSNRNIDFNKLSEDEQILEMLKTQKADRSRKFSTWTPDNETNPSRAERKINESKQSIDNQIIEKGQQEFNDPDIRGHKNKPIVKSHQGSPNSTGSAWNVTKQLKRIAKEWGSELGSTDSLVTPAAAEALADSGSGFKGINKAIAKELFGDERFKQLMEDLNSKGQTLQDVYGDAYERMQEVIGGRDAGALEPKQFWKPLIENIENPLEWTTEEILAADLIQQSLFKKLRDRAIAARELINVTNIDEVDGPLKYIRDNLIVGLEQSQRSRFILSEPYRLMANQKGGRKLIDQVLSDMHEQSKGRVDMMFDMVRNEPSDNLLRSLLEAFSMSNKISNWQDFDNYMREKLYGVTTEDGARHTGAMVKELQGVMMNSILSGPKTPFRALLGTSTATFIKPMAQILGGAGRYLRTGFTDDSVLREGLAELNAMVHTVPEAFEYFKHRLNSYWTGEISTIKSRYSDYTSADEAWDLHRYWAEDSGRATDGDTAAFRVTNLARMSNHSNFFNYNMKLLASTDDAFTMILARGRARAKALRAALDAKSDGLIPEISPEIIREYEARLQDQIFDPKTGTVNDGMLAHARGEVTLTKDLTGFAKSLNTLFSSYPALKPFYMFARTGINGLELTMKHTPGFNFLVKEFNDIAFASSDNLDNVIKYGIENAQDLKNAQDLQVGRLALGSSIIFMAGQKYAASELTGNGPENLRLRRVWEAAGWKPRSIKLGGVWVGHESLEPFTTILSAVADLNDNMDTLGPQAVERGMLSHALVLSKAMISKTYLQGLTGLTDLFGSNPKKLERIGANITNNMVPYAGLRNEIGKIVNPHTKELNSGFLQTIRNRNQFMEFFADEDDRLAVKYSILNGEPINNWKLAERLAAGILPASFNFDNTAGEKILAKSQFDLSVMSMTSPDGTSLADVPQIRSAYQRLIGEQKFGKILEKISKYPKFIASMKQMNQDIKDGLHRQAPGINAMSYPHNKMIRNELRKLQIKAWAQLQSQPEVIQLQRARELSKTSKYNRVDRPELSRNQYNEANQLLQMTNK